MTLQYPIVVLVLLSSIHALTPPHRRRRALLNMFRASKTHMSAGHELRVQIPVAGVPGRGRGVLGVCGHVAEVPAARALLPGNALAEA